MVFASGGGRPPRNDPAVPRQRVGRLESMKLDSSRRRRRTVATRTTVREWSSARPFERRRVLAKKQGGIGAGAGGTFDVGLKCQDFRHQPSRLRQPWLLTQALFGVHERGDGAAGFERRRC